MVKKWLTWGNYALVGVITLLVVLALYHLLVKPTDFPLPDIAAKKINIPKSAFARTPQDYAAIGPPALDLAFSPLSVQLPDLRRYLVYYGKNSRPDSNEESPVLFFSFVNNKTTAHVSPGERLYVMYDKKQSPPQYVFSENNVEKPLWIEATSQGNQAIVKVAMKGENGQIIREPSSYAEITLPEKEFVRFSGAVWELGKMRVDGTLLARQKARWYGVDKFIDDHGGEEYKDWEHKQRIDFGDNGDAYSVYVEQGDCLIWKDDRWYSAKAVRSSLEYPLMCVKKVDDRIMNLELWDVGGKGKMILNLVKSNETWMPQHLEQSFKFVGARTRSQFIFEINQERMTLSPQDWLIQGDQGWKKLVTPDEIDDYVDRKTIGPLFVFDRIERKDDRQVIIGTLYNIARNEKVEIELPLQQSGSGGGGDEKQSKTKKAKAVPNGPGDGRPPIIVPGRGGSVTTVPNSPPNPRMMPPVRPGSISPVVDDEDDDEDDEDDDDDE